MPNNCDNVLVIQGPAKDVKRFVKQAHAACPKTGDKPGSCNYSEKPREPSHLEFSAIVPLPKAYSKTPYSGERGQDGYAMEHEAWGVKWGACDVEAPQVKVNGKQGRAIYRYMTAWMPARKFLQAASRKFKSILFVNAFGGEGPIRGFLIFKGGKDVSDLDDRDGSPQYDDDKAKKNKNYDEEYDEASIEWTEHYMSILAEWDKAADPGEALPETLFD